MMENAQLFSHISSLPMHLQAEVADFVAFLEEKIKKEKGDNTLKERQFGYFKGKIKMSPDFDEPLEDFKDYM
jgi:hypothetical protein